MQHLINVNSIVLLITFAIHVGLGCFVLFRDRKNLVNRAFSTLLFCIALWTLGLLIFQNVKDIQWIVLARRFTPVGSSLIAGYFLYFSLLFPKASKDVSMPAKIIILIPGYVFSFISLFTDWMIDGVIIVNVDFPFLGPVVFGPAYKLFSIYFVSYFCLGLIILLIKYLKTQERNRLQIFYVLFGMTLSGILGITVSLILPLVGISSFFTSGPPFTLILAAFVTYAMVRHRLLDVDDFLSRGSLVVAGVLLLVGTIAIVLYGNFGLLLPFYTILANLGLGIFVLFRGRKNPMNQIFCVLTLLFAVWALAMYLSNVFLDYNQALFWNRMVYFAAAFIPAAGLYFSFYFPYPSEKIQPIYKGFPLVLAVFFAAAALFSSWIVESIYFVPQGSKIIFGFLHPFFAIYLILFLGLTFIHLIRKYNRSYGTNRVQILYFFVGSFISALPAVLTNVILPLLGNSHFTGLGPSFMLILVGVVGYAILKHRLMSIEVVIQKSSVYAVVTVLIMAFYAIAVFFSEVFLRQVMGYTSLVVMAAIALAIAIAYQPLVRFFQGLTDRIFFRGRYDYQKTLREVSQKIASVIQLEELSRLIVTSFIDTMKVSEISFLLLEKEREHFRSMPLSLPRYKKIEIDVESPIISWLLATKDILVRDELEDEIARQDALGRSGQVRKGTLEDVRDEMERLGIFIWVPIVSKDELIGIIALGNKLSGEMFSSEDIGLLSTLANQTAVALDNARLYDEVVNMKDYNEEILQSMVSGVLTVDNKGRIVTYNHMAEKITGRHLPEVLSKTCEEIWGKRAMISNIIHNTLKQDKCYVNFESSIASPERGLVPVSFSSTILFDHQRKKMGALLTIQDISEVKELEGKVRQADKLGALATMAAGMAHEIKNPLSSMKVLSQLLPKKIDDPEYRSKLSEIFPKEINRIDRIVDSLLGFARATALTFEKTDINDVIEENLTYFEGQAKASDIKIISKYGELPEIEVDRGQISQVFSNLVLNALQAMPNGGELTVKTFAGKEIEGILQNIKIEISDTGHGISKDMVKKLFDPFFTTKYGGTGLGLTITHSIVDGHKGYIDVESKPGQGTAFTTTLPVTQGLV
ncbi:MAG: GAF domain-containing protein [Candidatus Saganbacteria bacterium]|nr:GAF domain-containing protein [Candidatus Saganbacteria bacterium]